MPTLTFAPSKRSLRVRRRVHGGAQTWSDARCPRGGGVSRSYALWLVLTKAYRALAAHAEKSLNLTRAGLGDSDFRVLEALLHKGSSPVNTIGPKVWLTPGAISVAVDRLEKKELVKRKHTDDRRVRLVELTANGRARITKTFRKHASAMEEVAGVLSKEERLMLLRLLRKLGKGGADEP